MGGRGKAFPFSAIAFYLNGCKVYKLSTLLNVTNTHVCMNAGMLCISMNAQPHIQTNALPDPSHELIIRKTPAVSE